MKKFLIIIIVGFLAWSCEDFLEKEPLDSVAPEAFFETEEQTEIALNGMYARFNTESWYRRAIWNFTFLGTDIASFRARGNALFASFDTYTVDPSNRWIEGLMAEAYVAINAANTVINRVERSGLSEDFISKAVAEARFIRGLVYFDLVRVYGGVHVTIDETITPETDPGLFSRHSAAEVYDQIAADLTDARDNLPDVPRITGAPTSWSAQALLGKVMMQRAGTLADGDAATLWGNAAAELQSVINNGPYDLLPDYGDIFDIRNEGSMEHVFSIKFSRQVSGGHMGFRFLGPRGRDVVPGNGFHTILVDTTFYERYVQEDRRRLVTARADTIINGTLITYRDGLAINKYLDPEPLDGHRGDNDHIYMRFADVLLLAAEAINRSSGGPNAVAYEYVNRVRDRAGVGDLMPGLDQESFEEALLEERALELAYEGHRKFDLIRTDRLVDVMAERGIDITRDDYIMPIPQSILDELGWANNP